MTTRVVLAMMKHETNTFSPVPTDLARFSKGAERPPEGEAVLAAYRGTGSCIAGFIDMAEAAGAEIAASIAANAPPSGPVETAAYEHVRDAILASVRAGCDAILLDLHGAMVTERHEDGEGELLARIREIAPEVPIGVTLDMHANLYPAMVEHADVIAGYQTYPHIDYHETGVRAARPVFAMLRGEARPVAAWGNRPMLPHVMRQGSGDFPNRELQARGARDGGGGRGHRGQPLHRVPARRHRQRGARLRGGDGRRPGGGRADARRAARLRLDPPRGVRVPDRAARGLHRAGAGGGGPRGRRGRRRGQRGREYRCAGRRPLGKRAHASGRRETRIGRGGRRSGRWLRLRPRPRPRPRSRFRRRAGRPPPGPPAATARWSCSTTTTMRPPAGRWIR